MKSKLQPLASTSVDHLTYFSSSYNDPNVLKTTIEKAKTFVKEGEELFSVIVFYPRGFKAEIKKDNPAFTYKEEVEDSLLEQQINREIYGNKEHQRKVESLLEAKGINPSQDGYFDAFDLAFAKYKKAKLPSITKKIIKQEVSDHLLFSGVIDEDTSTKKCLAKISEFMKDKEGLKEFVDNLQKPQVLSYYEPNYEHVFGPELAYLFNPQSFATTQLFLKKKPDQTIDMIATSGHGSGTRENKGFYTHLYSYLHNHMNIPITTFVIQIESDMSYHVFESNSFICHGHDLTGNYSVNKEASEKFLQTTKKIYSFEDLAWEYFLQTKTKYQPEEKEDV